MKWLSIGTLFTPPQALPLLLVFAGLMWIIGLKKLAAGGILVTLAVAFSPLMEGVVATFMEVLPLWVSLAVLAVFVLGTCSAVLKLLIGERATDHVKGELALAVIRWTLLTPFRIARMIVQLIVRRSMR